MPMQKAKVTTSAASSSAGRSSGGGAERPTGRNIIVCCDGTGITEDHMTGQSVTPSNILKIFNCIDVSGDDNGDSEREQVAFYEKGVATTGNVLTRAGAGMTGFGIATKICIMYTWLGHNWREYGQNSEEEDRLFLFGFSRGAFAIRSLNGMLYRVGLLDLNGLDSKEAYRRVKIAYKEGYQNQKSRNEWAFGGRDARGKKHRDPWKFFDDRDEQGRIAAHFVGAFDTVGQLGMPRETWCLWTLGLLCCLGNSKHAYHDIGGNPLTRTARHAVAIDEMRSTFQPVFDRSLGAALNKSGLDFKQVWFPGCHGNVGGGLLDTGLSDGALKWMIDEASKQGLRFDAKMVEQIKPNYQANIYYTHGTSVYKNLTFYPRSMPAIVPENMEANCPGGMECIHESAILRSQNPPITDAPYFNTIQLTVGETRTFTLRADKTYNHTYVFLEKGEKYRFSATGRWSGYRERPCGPEGYSESIFRRPPAVSIGVGLGRLERGWRFITRNRETNLPFTRRHDRYPWYCLMGMISTGGTRDATAKAIFHKILHIGTGCDYEVEISGYLHVYANDNWGSYSKNKGFMEMTIERLAD